MGTRLEFNVTRTILNTQTNVPLKFKWYDGCISISLYLMCYTYMHDYCSHFGLEFVHQIGKTTVFYQRQLCINLVQLNSDLWIVL